MKSSQTLWTVQCMHNGAQTVERAATDIMYWGMPTVSMRFKKRTLMGDKQGTL